jgi:hypothetical protein
VDSTCCGAPVREDGRCSQCLESDRHTSARSIGLINANVELFAEFLKGRMPDQADEINLSVALWQQGDDDV